MNRSAFYFSVPLQSPRRTPTPSRRTRPTDVPADRWGQMAKAYARLIEQELNTMAKTEESRRWAHQAHVQLDFVDRTASPATTKRHAQTQMLEGLLRKPRLSMTSREARRQAEDAKRRIEEARRRAEQARLVREEYERIEARRLERAARIARRAEEEARQREIEEAQRRAEQAAREAAARRREHDAWRRYERQWIEVKREPATSAALRFSTIPWPTLDVARSTGDINETSVRAFILCQEHPDGATRRDRIRDALRRWHPDKFARQLVNVRPSERKSVEEAAGVVARVLNALAAEC